MKCPCCKKEVDDSHFACAFSSKGGSTTGPTKARNSAKMRAAAKKRWADHKKPGKVIDAQFAKPTKKANP